MKRENYYPNFSPTRLPIRMRMPHLIVIIDDEEDILDLLSYNFGREGFEVASFERATEALQFLSSRKPDAILCDWMMPGMDGLELCRKIKSDVLLADIPFIMVTCKSEKVAIRQAISEGVTDFVVKPVRIADLIARISSLLGDQAA